MRMRDCKRDAQMSGIYVTTREGAWTKKEEKPIVSNTDELGGGRYERAGGSSYRIQKSTIGRQQAHRIKYR